MNPQIKKLKPRIVKILKKHGVVRAGIFGSYVRGENKKGSDIDILIEVKTRPFSLFDLVKLEMELEKILKTKVDLLTYKGVSPYLKEYILADEVRII